MGRNVFRPIWLFRCATMLSSSLIANRDCEQECKGFRTQKSSWCQYEHDAFALGSEGRMHEAGPLERREPLFQILFEALQLPDDVGKQQELQITGGYLIQVLVPCALPNSRAHLKVLHARCCGIAQLIKIRSSTNMIKHVNSKKMKDQETNGLHESALVIIEYNLT